MGTTYLFAGGGTGGHLYPGLAIVEQLREIDPGGLTHFLASDRPLDSKILTGAGGAGVAFSTSPAKPLSIRPRGLLRFMRGWRAAVREARTLIRSLRTGPNHRVVVVAMGGFVAAPAARAATLEGVRLVLVNLDAVPGKANRWIARRATRILTAAPVHGSPSYARSWESIPPIVRRAAVAEGTRAECRARLGLDPDRPTLMITGGSQGARSINDFLTRFLTSEENARIGRGWQFLHQTGNDEAWQSPYQTMGVRAVVKPFVESMADWWGAADLAVCRAGAGNVAEVWANHVPALFMPYPFHRDEHQRYNAATQAASGGVVVCKDMVEAEANDASIGPVLRGLMESTERREAMRAALMRLGPADGAARVAKALLEP